MRKFLALIVPVGLLATAPLLAQPEMKMPKPGPEHEFLKQGVGTWDATAKAHGKESKAELHCKMAVGDLWFLEHYDATREKFEGYGATTYDATKKKFVNVWIDSMATAPMISEGTYDKEKKVLTLHGNMAMPEGNVKATVTITYKDSNTKVLSLRGDMKGKDVEFVEITYKRRVK
jgi:hypothetical protein